MPILWNSSTVTQNAWWTLSQQTSILDPQIGVDYVYKCSDIDGIRISDESWRNIRAYESRLSQSP